MGSRLTTRPLGTRRRGQPRVDAEGELFSAPALLSYVWLVLVVLTILEAADELFGIIGPVWIYAVWVHDLILLTCTVLVLGRTTFEPTTRRAWLAFGMALAVWCIGSIAWSVAYGARAVAPYPTFADIFWLLWYPLMAVGIYYLIRVRVPQFELHRWMDGIAATLVVLAVGFALVVQPAAEHTSQSLLATMVDFTYPVLDVLLIGAILGVYGLLGWRPDTMWLLVGLSVLTMSVADAVSAVQEAHSVVNDNHYAFMWTVGALLIALAAWVRTPGAVTDAERVTGMRAIALALFAQALAMGIQIYAVFREVGKSERIVTVVVLVVASVQIILTRPRGESSEAERPRSYQHQQHVAEPDQDPMEA